MVRADRASRSPCARASRWRMASSGSDGRLLAGSELIRWTSGDARVDLPRDSFAMTKARANAAPVAAAMIAVAAIAAVAAALLVPSRAAHSEEWPSRPIRFIVPYPAGGSTDVGARVIADVLAR